MSGRFFRAGRHAVQSALLNSRANRRPTAALSSSAASKFSITFTSAAAMMQAASMHSAPLVGNGGSGGAVGSARGPTTGGAVAGASAAGSRGCGAPSCCGGMSAVTLGDDAPSLNFNFSSSTQSASGGAAPSVAQSAGSTSSNSNNSCTIPSSSSSQRAAASIGNAASASTSSAATGVVAATAATPAASAESVPSPPPRQKCDPFEQGGHPLAHDVVRQHMLSTLDSAWQYDEARRMLVRVFDFRQAFGSGAAAGGPDELSNLFAFVASIGNIQLLSPGPAGHGVYNFNVNVRRGAVQVVLRTPSVRGISFADLSLATRLDGVFFRQKMVKEAKEAKEAKARQQAQRQQKQQTTTPPQPNASV